MSVDEKRSVDGEAIEELLREHVTEYQSCEGDDGASWLAGRILAALRAQGGGTDAISALVLENVLECIGLVRGELGDGKRADLADEEIRRVIMALRTQGGTGENEAHANRFVDEYLSAGHIVRAPSPSPREALEKTGRALAFAASVIKGGEPWTEQCEREIGGALRALTATEDQGGA